MSNVTPFPGTAREDKPQAQLTSAHRFLMYSILDLTIRITLETDHQAECRYSGHVHWFSVDVIPPQHQNYRDGGDNTYKKCYQARVNLPPDEHGTGDTLQQLGDIITALQQYLPTTGGVA